MKLFIDDTEIKTITKGLTIEGGFELVSRACSFSYVYDPSDVLYKKYKARFGSVVLIKNDKGKDIYKGHIVSVNADYSKKLINIKAQDMAYLLLSKKISGRFKGSFLVAIKSLISKYKTLKDADKFLKKKINVLSLGSFTPMDIICLALSKIHDEFKIYSDGSGSLEVLTPSVSNPKGTLSLGRDILYANFTSKGIKNTAHIKAF